MIRVLVSDVFCSLSVGLVLGLVFVAGIYAQELAQQNKIPDKAQILQLQDDLIDREKLILVLQEQILILRKQILEQEKSAAEPEIVKSVGGVQGQGWDYKARKLKPLPDTPSPDKTKKP